MHTAFSFSIQFISKVEKKENKQKRGNETERTEKSQHRRMKMVLELFRWREDYIAESRQRQMLNKTDDYFKRNCLVSKSFITLLLSHSVFLSLSMCVSLSLNFSLIAWKKCGKAYAMDRVARTTLPTIIARKYCMLLCL